MAISSSDISDKQIGHSRSSSGTLLSVARVTAPSKNFNLQKNFKNFKTI